MKKRPIFLMGEHGNSIIEVICGEHQENFQCCQVPMGVLIPNESDGAHEKHLPVVEQNGNQITVKVGDIYHPMEEKHNIGWVYLETEKGSQRVDLDIAQEPVANFILADGDKAVAAYAYCNLHGFWKTSIE